MKKYGFTLAETLITLGIIGVAATLVAPAFRHLIPSREKMEFMECYKQLTTILPTLNLTPNENDFEYKKFTNEFGEEEYRVVATCSGLNCINLVSEINNALGKNSSYTWNGDTYSPSCKHKTSDTAFTFYLNNNGTIRELDDNGKKFMKDQFNYYKKGNEDN